MSGYWIRVVIEMSPTGLQRSRAPTYAAHVRVEPRSMETTMKQTIETYSGETQPGPESTSSGFPKGYIPWIPLLGLLQLITTVAIFAAVVSYTQ